MLVVERGNTVGRGEIEIFLVDNLGQPVNAFEISYALQDVTTGTPISIGSEERVPVNPELGEYYAAFYVPENASTGLYRVRWRFRELAGGSENIVFEEFTVVEPSTNTLATYSPVMLDLIYRVRNQLRDNCVAGEESVKVRLPSGQQVLLTLEELYEITRSD